MTNIKKTILALTMGVAMIAGGSAIAAPKDNNIPNGQRSEQCSPDSCRGAQRFHKGSKGMRGDKGPRHHGKRHGRRDGKMMAFKGIELTQAQKDSVKAIAKREKMAVREGMRNVRQQAHAAAEKEIQQILTPEQFQIFQANETQMQQQKQARVQQKDKKKNRPKGQKKFPNGRGQQNLQPQASNF